MKRVIAYLLSCVMLLSLCACGGNKAETDVLTWQEQYDLGVKYLSEGNYEEAIIAFELAIEIDPKQPDAYLKAAEAYMAVGDLEKARAVLEQGISVTGNADLRAKLDELSVNEPDALYLLVSQSIIDPDDGEEDRVHLYAYNELGFCIKREDYLCVNDERKLQYAYTAELGTGPYEMTDGTIYMQGTKYRSDHGSDFEEQGSVMVILGEPLSLVNYSGGISTDPLFDAEERAKVMGTGGYADLEGGTHHYTFDDAGNPVHIESYFADGAYAGSCDLVWEKLTR